MRLIDADALKEMKFSGGMRDDMWIIHVPLREVMENIENAPTVATDTNVLGKWISVEDRLPEEGKIVLFAVKDYTGAYIAAQRGAYLPGDGWMKDTGWYISNTATVTHWMPLPEAPKEVTGDAD